MTLTNLNDYKKEGYHIVYTMDSISLRFYDLANNTFEEITPWITHKRPLIADDWILWPGEDVIWYE